MSIIYLIYWKYEILVLNKVKRTKHNRLKTTNVTVKRYGKVNKTK